jgi:PAS domain S-box-containing protein
MTSGIEDARVLPSDTEAAAGFARGFADSPTPAFLVDADGHYLWANRAYAELTGQPAELLVGDRNNGNGNGRRTGRSVTAEIARRSSGALHTGVPVCIGRCELPQRSGPPRWVTGTAFALSMNGTVAAGTLHEAGIDPAGEFAVLLDRTPVLVLTTDADLRYTWTAGRIAAWPDAGRPMVGRTAWEFVGTTDQDHPWIAPLRQALRGEQAHHRTELDGVHLDYWVGPFRDGHGRTVGTVAVAVDVTDAEQARRRQQVAEEQFRRLVEHSPAIIDVLDEQDRIVHANPAFLRTFGVRLPDVVGLRPDENVPGAADADVADLVETVAHVRTTGRARVWQGRIPHPDGHLVELLGHVFPMPAQDGSLGIGEVFVDVTAHERSRRELADSEQRFRAFFNGAEIGVLMLDLQARVLDANPAALRLTGRSLHDIRGRSVGIALTAPDVARHEPLWAELTAGRRGRYDLSVTLRSSDGRQRPARLTVTLVRSRDGVPTMGLGLAVPLAPETEAVALPARNLPSAGEAAVLERLAAGASLQQIATDLGMSRRGVDYRITRLRHKLRADGPAGAPATSAALIARAYALGILHPAVWPPKVVDRQQAEDPD